MPPTSWEKWSEKTFDMMDSDDPKNTDLPKGRPGASENSVTGRLKRYVSMTSAMGGTVAKTATNRLLGRETNHTAQALALTKAMGTLKGPVMKIAQMLATIPDAVPEEYALEFQSLQADAPSMGWPFVKRRMARELGPKWQDQFALFEQKAVSAASLGQVHKAVAANSSTALACKLQYPDMESTVAADLNQLKLALKIYEGTFGGLNTENIYEEISERLLEELDYAEEAATLKEYKDIYQRAVLTKAFGGADRVHVPDVIDDLSTPRLLTMSWLNGVKLQEILKNPDRYPQDMRAKMAELAFSAWYYPLFQNGIIHGDPHLGNYSFYVDPTTKDPHINLFDFGCVRRFNPTFLEGVKDLYHGMDQRDKDLEIHAFEKLGFTDLRSDVIDVLRQWAHLLYEPVLDDRVRPMQEGHSGVYGRQMAEKVHQELRKVGGVTPPREFVFMDRAAVGIGSLCLHLKAESNWCQLYRSLIT